MTRQEPIKFEECSVGQWFSSIETNCGAWAGLVLYK